MADSPLRVRIAPGGEPADPDTWDWVDVTDRAVEPVVITRGRSSESDTAGPANVTLTLRNDDGALSPRNPLGPWYGRLGLNTPLEVSWDDNERATVFLSELPTTWPGVVEVSRVPVRADGLFRRLGQGAQSLNSALHRYFARHPGTVAYWPGEDEPGAGQVFSPIRDVSAFTPSGVDFASADGPPGSSRLLRVPEGASGVMGQVPSHPPTDRYVYQHVFQQNEPAPGGANALRLDSSSFGARRWRIGSTDTHFTVEVLDAAEPPNVVVNASQAIHEDFFGQPLRVVLELTRSASSVIWRATAMTTGPDAVVLNQITDALASTGLGRVTQAGLLVGASVEQDRYVGHFSLTRNNATTLADDQPAFHGFTGELAAHRFERLCDEEGLSCTVIGDSDTSMPMGPQRPDTLLNLFREVEVTDGGVLGDIGELHYRTRLSRTNQDPAVELGEKDLLASPESTDDDRHIRNDVTASGRQGSSARTVDDDSVRRLGRYETTVNVNPAGDSRLAQIAAWHVHLGTTEEMRWPRVPVSVLKNPDLVNEWLALRVGDRLTAHNCFPQLPGLDIDLLVEGWTETLRTDNVRLDLNCSPARPWNVFELEHETFGRLWSPRAYLGEDIDDEATSFDVVVPVQRALNPVPDFESPITVVEDPSLFEFRDWATFGGTLERSNEQAFTGRWSGKFTPNGSDSFPEVSGRSPSGMAAAGRDYRADGWVYAPSAGISAGIGFTFYSNGTIISTPSASPVALSAGVWTRLAHTVTAPAGTTSVGMAVFYDGTPDPSDVLHIDDGEVGRPDAPFDTAGPFPIPIIVGGERMTVTAIGADDGTGAQTFTVTRSVNDVAKPHAAGSRVDLWPGHVMSL